MGKFNIFSPFRFFFRASQRVKTTKAYSLEKLQILKGILGFTPNNIEIYETAFIHRSATRTRRDGTSWNNETLEYLGDAILGAIIADMLFHKFPNADEGFLTQMRSKIVSRENLNKIAIEIGINKLVVATSNSSTSFKNIYGDAFEAFIGAIYLDTNYKKTEYFVINRVVKNYIDLYKMESTDTNFKSQLIEWGQKYKREIAFSTEYEGDDNKTFVSIVKIDGKNSGKGKGKSKKEAEQKAAQASLKKVENEYPDIDFLNLQFT